MTFTKQTTLWCDAIECPPFNYQVDGNSVPEARREAKAVGWTFLNGDFCPHHSGNCAGYGKCIECTANGWGTKGSPASS